MYTEISVFRPNSRKREAVIESLIPKAATNALAERLGAEVGSRASKVIDNMKRNGMEAAQIRVGDRRLRFRLELAD